jgi:hypothetical protein
VVSRVLRVQLAPLPDAEWTALRALARDASRFCNAFLAQMYCAGTMDGEARTAMAKLAYRHASRVAGGRLSGDVAVALSREAWTTWRKQGARVLSGAQRLACFDADRALVCRAEHWSKGRRQIHARMLADADGYRLSVRFLAKRTGDRQEFAVVVPPVSDDYQRPVLEGFVDGRIRLLKITVVFERPGRKVFALLTYEKPLLAVAPGAATATFGPLEPDGTLWLRWEREGRPQSRNYTQDIARLSAMKLHYDGIRRRLRAQLRRSGPGHRHDFRRVLVKAGSFSQWARGVLHQWSAEIVRLCQKEQLGTLAIAPLEGQELPMAILIDLLRYKCLQAGITVTRIDIAAASGERAITRPVEKQRRQYQKMRTALAVLKDAM